MSSGLAWTRISNAAGRPAGLLLGVGLDVLGGVAHRQDGGDVDRVPAALVQLHRGPHVLGLRAGVDPADLGHRRAAEDDVGAHAEGRVEAVLARLDEGVEDGLEVAGAARDEIVDVAVDLRGLNERHLLLGEERQRLDEEVRGGDEVGVEDDEEVARAPREGVVDVAGLGAGVVRPGQVVHAQLGREGLDLRGAAVVEDPRLVPPAHRARGGDRGADRLDRLAVGGDEDVDGDPRATELHGVGVERAVQVPAGGDEQVPAGLVEREVARVVGAGELRPQGDEDLAHHDRLRDDDERPGQQVAGILRPEEE